MKVLVTGAAGHVATRALVGLESRHELVLADVVQPSEVPPHASFARLSLLTASEDELTALFEGVDVVVHSAYKPSADVDVYSSQPPQLERFDIELDNIRMAARVYLTALCSSVRRVVVVSSNHAADWYEHAQIHQGTRDMVYPGDLPLSDNFYGWSKSAYELLGWPYACGTFGRRLEMVNLRIGSPYPIDVAKYRAGSAPADSSLPRPSGLPGFKRALGAFLSDRDCAQLFQRATEAEGIVGAGEVPWVVVYGVSANTRRFWSLDSARTALGYHPEDNSELLYRDAVNELFGTGLAGTAGRLGPVTDESERRQ